MTVHQNVTCAVFRTAYYIAYHDRPYTDHTHLIDLQSNVICADIIDHITATMRSNLVKQIVETKLLLSVLIDESTSLSRNTSLIVYIRTTFDHNVGPVTVFFDIISLNETTAEGIEHVLITCLIDAGFSKEFLIEYWVR